MANNGLPTARTDARRLWMHLETIHAVTYFAPESHEAADAAGLKGFRMGYFGFRAAPMGAVAPGVIEASFANFAPTMVRRAIPDAWALASPGELVEARSRAAAAALERISPQVESVALTVDPWLRPIVEAGSSMGRPLYAANRDLAPDDLIERLWQWATTLREHRGDGHVAALAAEGVSGCEAHLLLAADLGLPIKVMADHRGWTTDEWALATGELSDRGFLKDDQLTETGRDLRRRIETATDHLAAAPIVAALNDKEQDALLAALSPLATAVAASGTIPYPNPMGLPAIDQ